jgi:iron complex transport system substrate-binding protein
MGRDKMASGKSLMAIILVMVLIAAGVLGALVLMEPSNEDTNIIATFNSPSDGSTVTGLVNVTANITSKSPISYALLKMDGVELGNKSATPFYWHINTTHYNEGQHTLNITAFNAASKHAGTQITFVINNGNTTVAINSPNNQSKVTGTVEIVSQVVSPRAITYVACIVDGFEVGNVSSNPYSFHIDTKSYRNGNHNISVKVRDEIGQNGNAEVTVFFDNPFNTTDDRAKVIEFGSTPTRIITLGSSFTEILFAIGSDQQLIGVDNSSTYPAAASSKVQVGKPSTPTLEIIDSLNPDCIITWSYSYNSALISSLEGRGYKVVGYYPKNIADCERVIVAIGNLTGRNPQAIALVNSMEARLQIVADRIATIPFDQRPLVYYEQVSGKSVGNGTIGNEIITRAGGRNIYGNVSGNPAYNSEYVRDANPDFIIIDNASAVSNNDIATRAGWDSVSAVQDNHIYRINSRMWSITPRIVDAIEEIMGWLYPT